MKTNFHLSHLIPILQESHLVLMIKVFSCLLLTIRTLTSLVLNHAPLIDSNTLCVVAQENSPSHAMEKTTYPGISSISTCELSS